MSALTKNPIEDPLLSLITQPKVYNKERHETTYQSMRKLIKRDIYQHPPTTPPQITSNRDHKALNRGTLGGLGKEWGTMGAELARSRFESFGFMKPATRVMNTRALNARRVSKRYGSKCIDGVAVVVSDLRVFCTQNVGHRRKCPPSKLQERSTDFF